MKELPNDNFIGQRPEVREVKSPIEYFEQYFDKAFVDLICDESNKYAKAKNINSRFKLHPDEFKLYMANIFYMSLFGMNNVRRYWNTNSRIALIADSMALNRFEEIRRNIHFTSSLDSTDKFHKFRPILDQFHRVASSLAKDEHCSVDENTIPYNGKKSKLRQYNPKKTKKWGLKLFMLCTGEFGLIVGTQLYAGKTKNANTSSLLKSSQVVFDLAQVLEPNRNYKLAYDKWFASPLLMEKLLERGIHSVATIQINRFKELNFTPDNLMKKQQRGVSEVRYGLSGDVTIAAVKWYDNRPVHIASTYIAIEPVSTVKRWNFEDNEEIMIERPAVVTEYNSFMGQIDNIGCLLSLHRIKTDSHIL